jgi:hypothetical protein
MRAPFRAVALLAAAGALLVYGCSRQLPSAPGGTRANAVSPDLESASHGGHGSSETPVVVMSSGAIESDVAAFRTALGDPNNGATPGQQPAGRREVNWDGVPAEVTNTDDFPNDFFNTTSPRGLFYNRTGHGLEVSDRGFTDVNPDYAGEFNTFTPPKLFAPSGGNVVDVRFRVAGEDTKAAVTGIGVVFCDVDKLGSTTMELRGEHGENLGTFTAPVRTDERGLSFLAVKFSSPMISRVIIKSGDGRLRDDELDVTAGGRHDLVVMDNFLFGEPMSVDR